MGRPCVKMLASVLETAGDALQTFVLLAGLVLLLGVVAHAVTWLLTRRRAARWVWGYWNGLGVGLVVLGVLALAYGWLGLGLGSPGGSAVAALGLLILSAGLWMLVPV
jgi:hypothetical protein